MKRAYERNRYRNMTEDEKKRVKEYQKIYPDTKKLNQNFLELYKNK